MRKILIVEDDPSINAMLDEALKRAGYSTMRAYSGTEARLLLSEAPLPDLILLDLMLPGASGDEVLKTARGIPVIIVSARADVNEKISLLRAGAVDYITKPFNVNELLARVEVQLRIRSANGESTVLEFEGLTLDTRAHSVSVRGEPVQVTKTEYAILKLLLANAGNVVSRAAILDRISFDTPDCTERSLKQHIFNLRKKLRAAGGKEYIESVWGIGFKIG